MQPTNFPLTGDTPLEVEQQFNFIDIVLHYTGSPKNHSFQSGIYC